MPRSTLLTLCAGTLVSVAAEAGAQECQPGWSTRFAPPQVGATVNTQVVLIRTVRGRKPLNVNDFTCFSNRYAAGCP